MSDITRILTPYSYSSAVAAGDFVFLGLHRGSGDDFQEQIQDTFAGLRRTLAGFGLPLENIVKVNVWLKNIEDLPEMEKQFRHQFHADQVPARMTATTVFIDDDCLLMMDGIAWRGS